MNKTLRVCNITQVLANYRLGFYARLTKQLAEEGIDFRLIYGVPSVAVRQFAHETSFPGAIQIENVEFHLRGMDLCWQPALHLTRDCDLVIVEQATRLLINYPLFFQQLLGRKKIAFWGHGRNFQETRSGTFSESVKAIMSKRVHWWFAYNEMSAAQVRRTGFRPDRITNVQNAIDTAEIRQIVRQISQAEIDAVRRQLGVGLHTAVYIGRLYGEKRTSFLVEACDAIRDRLPDFHMIVIGDGAEAHLVKRAAADRPWLHYLGTMIGRDKVLHALLAKLMLMPGKVGLAVVDSFALETPMVTTNVPYHSPEIQYLENGANGVVVRNVENVGAYAEAVVSLLTNESARAPLVEGCRRSAAKYTIEEMSSRFAEGVMRALQT